MCILHSRNVYPAMNLILWFSRNPSYSLVFSIYFVLLVSSHWIGPVLFRLYMILKRTHILWLICSCNHIRDTLFEGKQSFILSALNGRLSSFHENFNIPTLFIWNLVALPTTFLKRFTCLGTQIVKF